MTERLEPIPVTEFAEINPSINLQGLSSDSPVSFIPMADVSNQGFWIDKQTRSLKHVKNGYTAFQDGDVLFAKITPCMENGKGCHALELVNGIGFGTTEFHVFRAKGNNSSRFIYHWLQSSQLRLKAESEMTGTAGQQRVPASFFQRFLIPYLLPEEQDAIADILDTIDAAIQNAERVIDKHKAMRAGLLHDLLTYGLDANGEPRDPLTHPEQFQESPLGLIPREWEVKPFEYLATVIDPKPDHRAPREVPNGDIYLGVGDLNLDGSINFDSCRHVSTKVIDAQQKRFTIELGDILFGTRGTIGIPRFLPVGIRYGLNSNTVIIKPKNHCHFLLYLLQSKYVENAMQLHVHSTSQALFGIQKIRAMLVPVPQEHEQQRIGKLLKEQDNNIENEQINVTKSYKIKQGLMDDLLTGRVRVSDVQTDEVMEQK